MGIPSCTLPGTSFYIHASRYLYRFLIDRRTCTTTDVNTRRWEYIHSYIELCVNSKLTSRRGKPNVSYLKVRVWPEKVWEVVGGLGEYRWRSTTPLHVEEIINESVLSYPFHFVRAQVNSRLSQTRPWRFGYPPWFRKTFNPNVFFCLIPTHVNQSPLSDD